tara:strand:+ start:1212 stop:1346 length:135 start_codon:yes stop_codon:yes gene_type:complete
MEFLELGGEGHGKTFVAVVLQDQKLTMFEKNISVERKDIEYIVE